MGGLPPEHSLQCNCFVLRDITDIFHDFVDKKNTNSLQVNIDFMTLASLDLSWHDVILATLIGEIHLN